MLTRLEVNGFKNLLDVSVELGPFTCIAGANGIGKSNVFDAIEFLSFLASGSLLEGAQRIRSSSGRGGGDPRDLFWDGYRDDARRMTFAAEMLVPPLVEDDLGSEARATTTFLRYELELGYEKPTNQGNVGRITLLGEKLRHITQGEAWRHLRFPHSAREFRPDAVRGERRGGAFLSTDVGDSGVVVNVHGDGGSRGRPQPRAAAKAGRTILSTVATNEYPTILAARREMESWRRLALEPSALRAPDEFTAPRMLGEDGSHIAATLFRIAHEPDSDGLVDPEAVYARVTSRLADLAGVAVERIEVELDQVREVFTLFLYERGGLRLPARALSEGTLRFLALCVLLEDPISGGVICMEEPENGIHPANLPAMLELAQDLCVDASRAPGPGNPLRQVIVNTHSPGVVQLCPPTDLLLAEIHRRTTSDGIARALTLRSFSGTWRLDEAGSRKSSFTKADVFDYLTPPPGAQLALIWDDAV